MRTPFALKLNNRYVIQIQKEKIKSVRNKLSSCHSRQVHSLVCLGITFIVILDINEELASTSLFENAHERRLEGLHVSCRHLMNL